MKISLFTIICFLVLNANLAQTTYYVDASANDDSNSGLSPSQAWKTIDKVNDQSFVPGDIILFKRGATWIGEQLEVADYSGTSAAPITFGAYDAGAAPVITVITTHSLTWVNQGNDIWKASNPPMVHPDRLWINGTEVLRANNSNELSMALFFWLYDAEENGNLFVKSTTNPASKQIDFTNGRIPLYLENTSYINFENLDFQGGWTSVYVNSNSNYLNFNGLSIGRHAGNGIDFNSATSSLPSHIEIAGCNFDADFTLDYSNAPAYVGSGERGSSDGIFVQAGKYFVISNNDFKNWGHASLNIDGSPVGDTIARAAYFSVHDNFMTSSDICYGGRIGVDDAHHCEIFNNQLIETSVQTQLAGHDNQYHHNLIVGTTNPPILPQGLEISAGISVESYSNTAVYNNIYENNLIANTEGMGFRLTNSGSYDIYDNIIRNNLFINCGQVADNDKAIGVESDTDECKIHDNDFLNNLIYNSTAAQTIEFRGNSYDIVGFNALDGTSGFEMKDNISDNPLLVDMPNGDYHLTENSPCINAGTVMLATSDFEGNPIPVGSAPDIGLYEYQTVLPITILTPFSARIVDNQVKLTWTTENEIQNDQFVISRSKDLIHWFSVTSLKPNAEQSYTVMDTAPFSGLSYYRLAQIDYDGRSHSVGQVSIYMMNDKITVFPNPAGEELHIRMDNLDEASRKVLIWSMSGKLILQGEGADLNIEPLAPGVYNLMVRVNGQNWTSRFEKY